MVWAAFKGCLQMKFTIIPCPHEATTTYGKGAKKGPAAILSAAEHVELFDDELGYEPFQPDWYKAEKAVSVKNLGPRVARLLNEHKIPIVLGGEHSITPRSIAEFKKVFSDLSVLQLDAHADLRDKYEGAKDSHACVMRRVLEICPAVQAGIRSISKEEWDFAQNSGQIEKIHWAKDALLVEKIKNQLSQHVYITIDVDVFDPSIVPATGTPEPGGLSWKEVLSLLKVVCRAKEVVGFDVVELAPRKDDNASDFTVAKLIYKLMGFITSK